MKNRLSLRGILSNSIVPSISTSDPLFVLPRTYGPITIHSLGTICPLPAFYSTHFIYPIGYSSTYHISAYHSIECSIGKSDSNQPVFSIKMQERVFQSSTPSTVWKLAFDEIVVNDDTLSHSHQSSTTTSSSSTTSTSSTSTSSTSSTSTTTTSASASSSLSLPQHGLDVFGLSIPEVASAIASLPGASECKGYECPLPLDSCIQNPIDWYSVLFSQWHPACRDFAMSEQNHSFVDPTIYSPIFFGMSDLPAVSCSVCHLPPTQSNPIQSFSLCDMDASLHDLLNDGKWNGGTTTTLLAHSSCGAFIVKRTQEMVKQLRVKLVEYVTEF